MAEALSNNKRIAKNTLFMYFRMFFTMCVSLYTSRVVLATLGFTDYGLNNVIGGIIAMFSFINGAMTNTTSRFITFVLGKGDEKRLKVVFSMGFYIHCLIALLIVILGETIGLWFLYNKMVIPPDRMFAAQWLYQLSIASSVMSIIAVPFSSSIIAHEKMDIYAYISIFDSVMKLLIVFLLAIAPFDKLIFYATLLFCIQILDFLFNQIYCHIKFPESHIIKVWDKDLLKSMGGFASWSLVGNFSYVFYSQGINLLINMFCGAAVNAARGIAVQVENAINQFTTNIQTAINPQIIKSYSQNNMHRMFTLIFASSKVCFYLMYILTLPVMLEATFILGIWLGKYPDHTINFLRLTLINTILNTLVNPMFTANLATGKVKIYHTVIGTLNVVCMPITYVVIRLTGIPETLFLLTVIMNMVGIFLRLFIMWKQIGMPITMWLHKVLLHIVLVVFSGAIIPFILYCMMDDTVSRFFAVCIACVICITLASYFLGLNVHERQMMTSKVIDIYHKKFRR